MSEEVEEIEGIDLEEIGKRYEEKGFFRRFADMCAGLGKPHNTREYKLARIEMQRLMAPLAAVVSVVLFVIILIVVTAVTGKAKSKIEVQVAKIEEAETELEETAEEEPPDEPPEQPPIEEVDIVVDTPMPGPPSPMANNQPAPQSSQVSVKPATQDTVAFVNSPVKMKSMVGSRSPGSRGAMLCGGANYGDAVTEAAVMKALRWLKKTQRKDGSWDATSGSRSAAACTGLAVLTFLAHGEIPATSPEFGPTVQAAIEWLVNSQVCRSDGTWTCKDAGAEEYGFLIATYALSEAYGMTKNPNTKEAAAHGLERMIKNQSPTGGWNYRLARIAESPDDISYGGWCMQAIKAGKLAGIHIDGMEECIKKAIKCLKDRNYNKDHGFSYRPQNRGYAGLAGVGCLAMQLLGYGKDPAVRNALDVMRPWVPCFDTDKDKSHERPRGHWASPQYYYYYAAQCKFQAGMAKEALPVDQKSWQDWNKAMKAFYPSQIKDDGEIEGPDGKPVKCGYWVNGDTPGHTARPVMDTCLAALQLMVYYRYLPAATLKADDGPSVSGAEAATDKSNDIDVSVDI